LIDFTNAAFGNTNTLDKGYILEKGDEPIATYKNLDLTKEIP
jgi:hypothetical protein